MGYQRNLSSVPRAHAWESPRSVAQGATLATVVYIVVTWIFCTIPALSDIVHFGAPTYALTKQYATVLLHWSPFTQLLAAVVLLCYLVICFKDPSSGQPLLEKDAGRDCVPICAHCSWPLRLETFDKEAVTVFTCDCCGAVADGSGDGLLGLWAYGLHGLCELEIRSGTSGDYEILDGCNTAMLRRLSAWTCDGNGDTYEAQFLDDARVRLVLLGRNALRISRSTASECDWQPFAVARRKVGGSVVGEWSMPVWNYNTSVMNKVSPMPDCWQCFEVTKMQGSQDTGDLIIKEERHSDRRDGLVMGAQAGLEPNEVAQGLLRPETLEPEEGERGNRFASQSLVAQLYAQQGGQPCGWVRLKVDADHLIYQYRPEKSDHDDWGAQCVALRGGSSSFACCERCGLASQPPSPAARYTTGHCNYCHKCIPGFDHHCIFLNQCVGQRNYMEWFALIASLLVLGMAALMGALLVLCASSCSIIPRALSNCSLPFSHHSWQWILAEIVAVIGSVVLDVFLFQLVAFHCWLMLKRQTTTASVFNTTAVAAFERRRTRHLWRLCQSVAKRRCLKLPPPPSLELPGTPNAFAQRSELSLGLPGTPHAFAQPSLESLDLPGTPHAFAQPSPLSVDLPGTPNAFARVFNRGAEVDEVESETMSPTASWCGSPKRSVDAIAARAVCAGTTLDSADEDFSGPFLELRRGTSDLLGVSPIHSHSLSSPLLQHEGRTDTSSVTSPLAHTHTSPARKALSFSGL